MDTLTHRLSPLALGLALGTFWALSVLLFSLMVYFFSYGEGFVTTLGSLYKGFDISLGGILLGTLMAFVDGLVSGLVIGWFYNMFKKCCKTCGFDCSCDYNEPVKPVLTRTPKSTVRSPVRRVTRTAPKRK